jgi:hypothetical protein
LQWLFALVVRDERDVFDPADPYTWQPEDFTDE